MQQNLLTVYNLLHSFSTGNTSIEDYQFGNLSEITTSKSQKYPLMYVELGNCVASEQTMTISFNILIGKQENNDRSNRIEIYNSTLNLQNDLLNFMYTNAEASDYVIDGKITLTPFTMKFNNLITGWFMSLPITITRTSSC